MLDVVTIGTATRDVFLESNDFKFIESDSFSSGVGECLSLGSKNEVASIFFSTGGGATNAAVTFARLGLKTAVVARVGKDISGEEIVRVLKKEKVDTRLVERDSTLGTAYSTLLMHGSGERTILVYRGASVKLSFGLRLRQKLSFEKPEWFYVTSLGGQLGLIRQIWQSAKKHGVKISWNPGGEELKHGLPKLAPFIKQCVVFNINREEAARLTTCEPQDETCFVGKLQDLAAITLVTDGKHGAYCYINPTHPPISVRGGGIPHLARGGKDGLRTRPLFVPSLGTKPRNTTGAGDAFGSGFVAGLVLACRERQKTLSFGLRLRQKLSVDNVQFALSLAILNADSVIRNMGAKTGILKKLPSKQYLDRIKVKEL